MVTVTSNIDPGAFTAFIGTRVVAHDDMPRITHYFGEPGLTPVFAPHFPVPVQGVS